MDDKEKKDLSFLLKNNSRQQVEDYYKTLDVVRKTEKVYKFEDYLILLANCEGGTKESDLYAGKLRSMFEKELIENKFNP